MNKILLIVDPQYDFLDKEGSKLPVNGATAAMDRLIQYVRNLNPEEYKYIVFTCDWHPTNHSSFETWPPHCIQHTYGASIYKPLIDAVQEKCEFSSIQWTVFEKGKYHDKEEYSFLQDIKNTSRFKILLTINDIKEVEVCGIAKDYCVKNTVHDLITKKRLGEIDVTVIDNLCPAIGDNDALNEFYDQGVKRKEV